MKDARNLRWWLFVIIIACAGLYLFGNGSVPLWDRDEGWYAQCSKQMWESGDWVVPRFMDQLRMEKPALVYWLQLGGYWLFGGPSEFAVRFYSAIAMALALCILGYGIWRLAGPSRAVWTVLTFGTCVMAIISAKMCLTDATMMVFILIAQMILLALYLGHFSWWALLLMFLSLGFGALTKGPIALVPTLMTAAALLAMDWQRWVPYFQPTKSEFWNRMSLIVLVIAGGLVIIAAVPAPWLFLLIKRAPEWLPGVLDMARQHIMTSLDGHTGWPLFYPSLLVLMYFPWALLVPVAAYVAWRQRHIPQTRFCMAAIIGLWVVIELMKTKLPHYWLPSYPFWSFLVADAIVRCSRQQYLVMFTRGFVTAVGAIFIPFGIVASVPWLAMFLKPSVGQLPYLPMAVVSILGFVVTVGTWWFFKQRRVPMACAWLAGSFMVLFATVYGWLVPQSTYLQTSPRVAELLGKCDGLADKARVGEVATILYKADGNTVGFQEPTLVYYQGGTMRMIEEDKYLEKTPAEKWPRVLVLTSELWDMLEPEARFHLKQVGTVRGYLYSDVHGVVDVIVATKVADPTP